MSGYREMAIRFGRFSDSFKLKEKVDAWKESEKLFEEKKFLDSYNTLFRYIRDDNLENVKTFPLKRDFENSTSSLVLESGVNDIENKARSERDI